MTRAFIFPGQGSQFVGMGKDLYDNFEKAKHVFEEVDEALSQNLSKLMFEGPEEELNLTENTQPALMAVSVAAVHVLVREGGIQLKDTCTFMAGHSLGEYSALTATSAIELSDTARLLKLRGQSMQKAVPVGKGAMAAILGMENDDLKAVMAEAQKEYPDQVCQIANDNSPGQIVISGDKDIVEKASEVALDKGAKRAVPLPVSAPFHCTLMAPAAQTMAQALADTTIRPPSVPIISNVTAQAEEEPTRIRQLLVDQITHTVRWREGVEWMGTNGVTEMIELGAGKVLNGLVRRINRDITVSAAGTAEQINALIENLK